MIKRMMNDDFEGFHHCSSEAILSPFYHELPLEIVKECFSFLDQVEVVFGIGFVCQEWRRTIAWPILSHHIKKYWLVDCIHDGEKVNCFEDLFGTNLGRNCLRFMMRSFVFNIAQHEVAMKKKLQQMKQHDSGSNNGVFKLNHDEYSECVQLLKFYFSKFKLPSTLLMFAKYQRSEVFGLKVDDEPTIHSMRENYKKNPKYEKNLYTHKILILGRERIGKTNFLNSISELPFSENPIFEEYSFRTRYLNFGDLFCVKSQIWEMNDKIFYYCPQLFDPLCALYLTFDITNRSSFDTLIQGLLALRDHKKKYTEVVIIGFKGDLRDSKSVSRQEIERVLIQQLLFEGSYYIEVSSKNRTNIESAILFTSLMVSSIHLFTNIE